VAPEMHDFQKLNYRSIVSYINKNSTDGNHTFVVLDHAGFFNYTKDPGYKLHKVNSKIEALQLMPLEKMKKEGKFYHYLKKSEQYNTEQMDIEHARLYFHDPELIEYLKEQNFDLGIGSHHLANSLLFKAVGIPYIKIHQEDFETSSQQLYGMEVPSYGPNSFVQKAFKFGGLPELSSLNYRLLYNFQYLKSMFGGFKS
jgi:hypothetical protein